MCVDSGDLEVVLMIFESFEKGKKEFKKLLKKYAFSKNTMFDGEGNVINLKRYAGHAL